jgi:ATP phosphoribosyltransferase
MSEPLRIAITKGRLLDDSIRMFQKIGASCSELLDPGRRLVLGVPELGRSAVLAKAPDVVTYVEQGVCALGIVGKDTLMEVGGSFYEVLDLGYGRCRFALAAPRGFSLSASRGTLRIASKYPNVTRAFFRTLGQDVTVIKIEGSVELAPVLGLADAIVDIVETGNTLKANGLEIVSEVAPVSARLIVNTAAMKLRKNEILDLTEKCRGVLNA